MELDLDLLASIASGGLGRWIEADDGGAQTYVKDEDCIGCLKDLQVFFRDDDPEERPAFFAVSQFNFARSDLVPLIVTYPEEYDVVFNALKVCTFLTMASPDVAGKHAAQQAARMQQVCEAFLARDALAVIVGLLADPLSRHPKMSERDSALVQLVITFLRNLLAAATPADGASPAAVDSSRRIKRSLVQRLFHDNVLDLLMLMAQHARERPFRSEAPVMVEIFLRLFDGTTPEQLLDADEAVAAAQRSARHASGAATSGNSPPPQQQQRRPAAVQHRLSAPRIPRPGVGKSVARFGPARQTFSGAVYVRRHIDHSGNVVVRHTPNRTELPGMPAVTDPKRAKAHTLERGVAAAASTAGAAAPAGATDLRALALTVRLNGFMRRFLEEAYTPLLGQVQKELRPGLGVSQLSEAEFESFVRLVTVCTKYVRIGEERRLQCKLGGGCDDGGLGQERSGGAAAAEATGIGTETETSPFACVSATLGWDTFHFVQVTWILTSEADSRGAKQKNGAGKAWGLQHALAPLLKEMLLALDLARVGGAAADRRAADRLQRRLLHDDLKDSGLLPVVARLIKGYNYRFQPRQHAVDLVEVLHVVLGTLDRLAAQSPGGFRVAQAARQAPRRQKPALGVDPAEVGAAAVAQQPGGAEAAPGEPAAGDAAHQDVVVIAEDAPDGEQQQNEAAAGETAETAAAGSKPVQSEHANAGHTAQQQQQHEEEEEERRRRPALREVAFEADKRLRQELAQPAMLHFYTWLLQGYRTNAPFTNHALVSYLNRIARPPPVGLGLEPMLWQLSVLRLFHTILADKAIRGAAEHAALVQLCSRVTRSVLRRIVPDLYCPRVPQPGDGEHGGSEKPAEEDGAEEEPTAAASRDEARKGTAEVAAKMRTGCASMMCVELLFWKGPNVASGLAEEYNWRKVMEPEAQQQRPGRAAGGGQLGFASYRAGAGRAGQFTEEQAEQLQAAFERCNGCKDCLDQLVEALGGAFKKAHISRQLKAMGLVRGKLTVAQGAWARELYESHADKGPKSRCAVVAEELSAGFTGNQVKRHLVQMGVVAGKRRGDGRGVDAWEDMLGSEGEDGGGGDSGGEGSGGGRGAPGRPSPPLVNSHTSDSDSDPDEADGEQAGLQRGSTEAECPSGEWAALSRAAPPRPDSTPTEVVDAELTDTVEQATAGAGAGSGRKRKSPMDATVPGGEAREEAKPERLSPVGKQGPSAAQRASALEALRRKPLGAAAEERVVEEAEAEAKENAASGKVFARRRLTKAGDACTLAAPPPVDLDLEDF